MPSLFPLSHDVAPCRGEITSAIPNRYHRERYFRVLLARQLTRLRWLTLVMRAFLLFYALDVTLLPSKDEANSSTACHRTITWEIKPILYESLGITHSAGHKMPHSVD